MTLRSKLSLARVLTWGLTSIFTPVCTFSFVPANALAAAGVRKPAAKKVSRAKVPAQPQTLIAQRTQKVLTQLKSRPVRPIEDAARDLPLKVGTTKGDFLAALYANKLVDASWATEMLSDKRIFAEVLTRELGPEKARRYFPKTVGLREFLIGRGFLDAKGEIKTNEADAIETALYQEFPSGFVVRAAVGVAPNETTKGLFIDTDSFLVELMKQGTALYHPSHASSAVSSHILGGQIASGEAVVLQENLTTEADSKKPLLHKYFQEVRVHTYEAKVVLDAVPMRWVQRELLDQKQIEKAEAFVQDFLRALPSSIVSRQAWGLDVAVFDNGEMKLNDVVTNRGAHVAWSSYLEQPRVIEAYADHLEAISGVRFEGVSGWMITHGFANYFPFWQRRIEKARPGLTKVLAYLPPWP